MSSPTTPERAEEQRRIRSWRRAFLVYAVLLTIGTHWPKLRLTTEVPITDKTAHLGAFALLTVLLWRTRWIRSRWLTVLAAATWAGLDEWSQGLPLLERFSTWHDRVANLLGVTIAGAWIWALRTIGGSANRMRLALHECAFDRLLLETRPLAPLVGAFVACALPVVLTRPFVSPEATGRIVLLAGLVWLGVSTWIGIDAWRRSRAQLAAGRTCFACGGSCAGAAFDDRGHAACPTCGRPVHAAQWTDPAPPTVRTLSALALWPTIVLVGTGLVVTEIIVLAPAFFAWAIDTEWAARPALRIARLIGRTPAPVSRAVDLAAALCVLAVAVRLYRGRLARHFDRSVRCRRCGHDLRATPTTRGVGVCGECGTQFVTLEPAS